MNELALFAGAGGGLLGSKILEWTTKCAVEINPYRRRILLERQKDGHLPKFAIWDNVRTFNGWPWRGIIDVVTGGFPCTDISSAGKGEGITGKNSSLFFEMLRIVEEVRPKFVFAENSPNLRTRGLGAIIKGLTSLGYLGCHGVLGAWHFGAPHKRDRIWIVACDPNRHRKSTLSINAKMAWLQKFVTDSHCKQLREQSRRGRRSDWEKTTKSPNTGWWATEPRLDRVAHGLADRMDRQRAIGDGQVPIVAAIAWTILKGVLDERTEE